MPILHAGPCWNHTISPRRNKVGSLLIAGCGSVLTGAVCTDGEDAATGALAATGFFTAFIDTAASLGGLTISSGPGLEAAEVVVLALFFVAAAGLAAAAGLGAAEEAAAFLVLASEAAKAAAFFSYFALRVCGHFLPVAIWQG